MVAGRQDNRAARNAKKGYWYEDLQDIWVIDVAKGTERTVKMQIICDRLLHSLPVCGPADGRVYFRLHGARRPILWSVPAAGGVATR